MIFLPVVRGLLPIFSFFSFRSCNGEGCPRQSLWPHRKTRRNISGGNRKALTKRAPSPQARKETDQPMIDLLSIWDLVGPDRSSDGSLLSLAWADSLRLEVA